MSFLEPGCRFAEPLEAFGCDVRSLPSAGACHSSGKMENPFPGLLHPSRSAQVQEDPLSSAQLFTVGTRQLLRGHLGLHLFPSSTDKGPLPSQTGASMFPAHCLKQCFLWPPAGSGLFVTWRSGCLVLEVVWEENLPSRGIPWSLLTPHRALGDAPTASGCPGPRITLSTARGAGPARGCSLHFWAMLLPGGVMKTHNGVSFSWTPSAFSIQHIIQEILVYTLEELL